MPLLFGHTEVTLLQGINPQDKSNLNKDLDDALTPSAKDSGDHEVCALAIPSILINASKLF